MDGFPAAWADQVDTGRLMQHCERMAQWMKLSGTPAELDSLKAVQAQLDGFGYRTQLIHHDAYISLPGEASVVVGGKALTAITHSFSLNSPPGGLRAPVSDVGEGKPEDFAGRDLRGHIVLARGIANPGVAALANKAGAAGQLHVSPHEHLHEMCISPVWGSPSAATLPNMPSAVTCTISNEDGEALAAALARGEAPEVVLHAKVDTGWRKTPILQADMDGPDPDGEFILFSGHHDTWYYGVMDNGSANATMLEVARLMAGNRAHWKRNFRLCFWSGHSHGRYSGSTWYADSHWDELNRRCAVHVNVDSTGGIGATVLTETAVVAELVDLASEAIRAETNQQLQGRRPNRNSDMSFWGVGIPSMFGSLSHQPPAPVKMRNALGWWWHTPHDLLDKIDPAFLARDTKVFVRSIARLLTDDVLPLDYAAHADALVKELQSLAETLADRLPLTPLLAAGATLRDVAAKLPADPKAANRALMAASRALVPVDYTSGDRFRHDPALPMAPYPVLDPIRALAAAVVGDAAHFAMVDALRARNRMHDALQRAIAAFAPG